MNFFRRLAFAAQLGCICAFLLDTTSARADEVATFAIGSTIRLSVTSDGTAPFNYQWKKYGVDIAGATSDTYVITNAQPSDSGMYTVSVTNAVGSTLSDVALVGVGASPPSFTANPSGAVVDPGAVITLSVGVTGSASPSVQWQRNGVDIPGATSTTLTLSNLDASTVGTYTAVVSNFIGYLSSNPAVVALRSKNRLADVSIRSIPGTGANMLIAGFVTTGDAKAILIRAIGPGLAPYMSSPTTADPNLELYRGSETDPIAANDNWGGTAQLTTAFARLGAFSLPAASKDAALLTTLSSGVYSAKVGGDGKGFALAEIYDADTSTSPNGRIVNLSARTYVGTGDGQLIAGFVIAGSGPKRLLIRAIGPTLTDFGVPGALADPRLDLYAAGSTTVIASNDNWGGAADLVTAFTQTGAFSLSDNASKDAAALVTLNPGAYSAIISGVNNSTGVAMVEIYEMP